MVERVAMRNWLSDPPDRVIWVVRETKADEWELIDDSVVDLRWCHIKFGITEDPFFRLSGTGCRALGCIARPHVHNWNYMWVVAEGDGGIIGQWERELLLKLSEVTFLHPSWAGNTKCQNVLAGSEQSKPGRKMFLVCAHQWPGRCDAKAATIEGAQCKKAAPHHARVCGAVMMSRSILPHGAGHLLCGRSGGLVSGAAASVQFERLVVDDKPNLVKM